LIKGLLLCIFPNIFTALEKNQAHWVIFQESEPVPSTVEQQQISAHDWNILSNSNNFPIAHGHIKDN